MSTTSSDPLIGKQLGDYTIQSMLGQGGMARVYRGYDAKLDRYAAVKVIEPNVASSDEDKEYRERFLREARAIARLNHSAIVNIFQFGQNDDETLYYMAMGFIEGRDLRHIIKEFNKQGKYIGHTQVLRIFRDIATALDYSHQQGVIHRDVKPSNIMVKADGHAVLTDFGLALNAQEGTIGNTFGSVHYIAPEQAVSSAQAVPQSDLYSLGVVLFEMLTGRVPFEDVSAMSVALKHISDPPPKPSDFNPNIPPQVENVILRALDKDPEERFESGAVFIKALDSAFAMGHTEDEDTQDLPAPVKQSLPGLSAELASSKVSDDTPTISDSTGTRPGSLPFSPLKDEKPDAGQKRSRTGLLAAVVLVAVAIVLIGGLLASGALSGSSGDPTPTQLAAVLTDDDQGTDVAVADVTEETGVAQERTSTPEPTDTPELTATRTPTVEPTRPSAAATSDMLQPTGGALSGATSTPEIRAGEADEPQVLLRYDGRSLVLYNRAPSQRINISTLTFVRIRANGSTMTFAADEWGSEDLFALRAEDCFQLFTVRYRSLPADEFPAEICNFRQGFFSTVNSFWTAPQADATFEVRRDGDVLATCPAVLTESTEEVRCLVELREE